LPTDCWYSSSPSGSDSSLLSTIEEYLISTIIDNQSFFPLSSFLNQSPEETEKALTTNIYPSLFIPDQLIPVFLQRFQSQKLRSLIFSFGSFSEQVFSRIFRSTQQVKDSISFWVRTQVWIRSDWICNREKIWFYWKNGIGRKSFWQAEDEEEVGSVLDQLRTGADYELWKMKVYAINFGSLNYLFIVVMIRNIFPVSFFSKFLSRFKSVFW